MNEFVTVIFDHEIDALLTDAWVRNELDDDGRAVAAYAARIAPKRTGAGAASISQDTRLDAGEWVTHISWDQLHRYMVFPDVGTRYQRAQHFLETALDQYVR